MQHSIMLVDDDASLRGLMKLILTRAGYNVYEVEDGNAALEVLETSLPDLFIVDVMMPGMNGYELCQHLRANPQTQTRPLFLLSARNDKASIEEGLASGADLYLAKPLGTDELVARIQEFLNKDVQL